MKRFSHLAFSQGGGGFWANLPHFCGYFINNSKLFFAHVGENFSISKPEQNFKFSNFEGNFLQINRKFTHLSNLNKKCAFTLAEVLITLGIIGVVVAMTLPTLIQDYKKTVIESRLAKFYSIMNQAIERAEADYGDKTYWEDWQTIYVENEDGTKKAIPNIEYFNKYFAPYLSITKVDITSSSKVIVYLADGSVASFGPNSIQFWPVGNDFGGYLIDEDTGKLKNNMEASGIKYFTFMFSPKSTSEYHYNLGVEPYKVRWDGTKEMLLNDDAIGCKESVSNERAYCAALIQHNGWKIPKDYPLKF